MRRLRAKVKSREHVVTNGRAAFYACMWEDLRSAALNCGWALGLHGSLSADMDIMAMAWTDGAAPVETMIRALSDCFTENLFTKNIMPPTKKPNGRLVYTMSIWADFYLDINIIDRAPASPVTGPTAADLLAWFKARPGASWLATIQDIETAMECIRSDTDPKTGFNVKRGG